MKFGGFKTARLTGYVVQEVRFQPFWGNEEIPKFLRTPEKLTLDGPFVWIGIVSPEKLAATYPAVACDHINWYKWPYCVDRTPASRGDGPTRWAKVEKARVVSWAEKLQVARHVLKSLPPSKRAPRIFKSGRWGNPKIRDLI